MRPRNFFLFVDGGGASVRFCSMKEITDGIFYCGKLDKQREIFDQLVPLKQGTSYNSYLVRGAQKTALIDTMYAKFADEYVDDFISSGAKVDYIVSNHAEPDHSGAIPLLLEKFPSAQVFCTDKCAENLANMLGVSRDKITVVKDGDTLSLGGKTLRFIPAPWVHWPDTMFTLCEEDKALFTCDFFGAHYTNFDIFADKSADLRESAKRYYAEIMMPFRNFCAKYLAKVLEMGVNYILPSHGPVYRGADISFITDLYAQWTSADVARKVVIAYVSMYDNAKIMSEYLAEKLKAANVEVVCADIMQADEGVIAEELVDAAGLVLGTSMVLSGPHPKTPYVASLANILKAKIKFYAVIGSFGWGGKLSAAVDAAFTFIKPKKLPDVVAKGRPTAQDFANLDALSAEILQNLPE